MASVDESKAGEDVWTNISLSRRKKTWSTIMSAALKINHETLMQVTSVYPHSLDIEDPHEDCSFGGPGELTLFWTDDYVYSPQTIAGTAYFISVPRHPVDMNRFPVEYDCIQCKSKCSHCDIK